MINFSILVNKLDKYLLKYNKEIKNMLINGEINIKMFLTIIHYNKWTSLQQNLKNCYQNFHKKV